MSGETTPAIQPGGEILIYQSGEGQRRNANIAGIRPRRCLRWKKRTWSP